MPMQPRSRSFLFWLVDRQLGHSLHRVASCRTPDLMLPWDWELRMASHQKWVNRLDVSTYQLLQQTQRQSQIVLCDRTCSSRPIMYTLVANPLHRDASASLWCERDLHTRDKFWRSISSYTHGGVQRCLQCHLQWIEAGPEDSDDFLRSQMSSNTWTGSTEFAPAWEISVKKLC